MENLTFTQKLYISVCLGFLLLYASAEEQYFINSTKTSWEEARNQCQHLGYAWTGQHPGAQVCYKEMVTLTPQNVYIIGKMINSDHWIGLRKYINYNDTYDYDYEEDPFINPNNFTNTSFGTPWTRWANGDPLIFQNWYPGYPVFKSPPPKIDCCSCSCTCPAPTPTTTNPPPVQSATDPLTGRAYGSPTGPNVTEDGYENMTDFTSLDDWENITDMMASSIENNRTQLLESSTLQVHTTDSPWTTTMQPPISSTCERSPIQKTNDTEINKNYIEDSCVVILSFGPWVERVCTEKLPSICYEERFMGRVNISNITSSSATLQWEEGPGNIDRYRLEAASLKGSWNKTKDKRKSLSDILDDLTPGTGYKIQVFPVKCERDLNPQNGSFYTIPGEVKNLSVTYSNESSVSLSWEKPDGNYDFFSVTAVSTLEEAEPVHKEVKKAQVVFDNLIQGNEYDFIVVTGVSSRDMWSENVSISECTLPGKVSSLKAKDNSDVSLYLTWEPPTGNYTTHDVKASIGNTEYLDIFVGDITAMDAKTNKVKVSNLPNGNEIKLRVRVRSKCNLTGTFENITTYTAPGPIENLTLEAKDSSINAKWDFHENHKDVAYRCELYSGNNYIKTNASQNKSVSFDQLKTATNYTVKVYAVLNNLDSPGRARSIFTLPSPPTEARVIERTTDSLTFEWTAPKNSSASQYNCALNSTFWGFFNNTTASETKCKFTDLQSGSTYGFKVSTFSNGDTSEPASCTGETVTNETEINLSMLCNSNTPLYCDKKATRENVLEELKKYFKDLLDEHVFYEVDEKSII